jgi:hypothetical protein
LLVSEKNPRMKYSTDYGMASPAVQRTGFATPITLALSMLPTVWAPAGVAITASLSGGLGLLCFLAHLASCTRLRKPPLPASRFAGFYVFSWLDVLSRMIGMILALRRL